jgi:hypothetical protein
LLVTVYIRGHIFGFICIRVVVYLCISKVQNGTASARTSERTPVVALFPACNKQMARTSACCRATTQAWRRLSAHPGPPPPRASAHSSGRVYLSSSNCHGEIEGREGMGGERRGEDEERHVRLEPKPCCNPLSASHRCHCNMCNTRSTFKTSRPNIFNLHLKIDKTLEKTCI